MMDAGTAAASGGGDPMGLIKEGDDFAVLSDILGDEDHQRHGLQGSGYKAGITSLQMDIKITSITREIMDQALIRRRTSDSHSR